MDFNLSVLFTLYLQSGMASHLCPSLPLFTLTASYCVFLLIVGFLVLIYVQILFVFLDLAISVIPFVSSFISALNLFPPF